MLSGMVPLSWLLNKPLLRTRAVCRPFDKPQSEQHQPRTSSPHTQSIGMETGPTDQEQRL